MSELEERDWKQLLPELIHLIAKKLPDVLNFVRFRSVCKAWQSFAPLSDPPTQFPWIYQYPEVNSDSFSNDTRAYEGLQSFYSISAAETLTINVKTLHTYRNPTDCMGVCCHNVPFVYHRGPLVDWVHRVDLYLYNPLTKREFIFEFVPLSLWRPYIAWTGSNSLRYRSTLVLEVDSESSENPEMRAGLAFFDSQCENWIVHRGSFSNAFLCQGKLFTTEKNGYTMVWHLPSKILSHKIPPPDNEIKALPYDKENPLTSRQERCTYILESCGIILRVYWITNDWQRQNAEDSIFHIYKLQFDGVNEHPCWIRLYNIGNQVLFLDKNIAFSMSSRPSTGFKAGCIYFLSIFYNKLYVYDVLAGTIEKVSVPSSFECCSWFVPGLF